MDWAAAAGILNGRPGNLMKPGGAATQAEMSAILVRFIAWHNKV
ncbi:S-layer homology domain-containing protein [Paenibacillus nanensis]|uniref:S-layer homology domain-containing protein n=2 Tax=Paenibacillus nanensis TaxID=393251 RepID=A0A3A1VFD6_9BACL|nr:S-layer homology domain-containing protein [Paenibacillus nanensis]